MGKKQKVTNEMALYEFMSVGRLMLARIFAMGLSLFFLWNSIYSTGEFFKSLVLIIIAQLLYNVSIKAKTTIRSIFSFIVLFILLVLLFMGFIGVWGNAVITPSAAGPYITIINNGEMYYLFRSVSVVVFMAFVFPIIYIIEWVTGYNVKGG